MTQKHKECFESVFRTMEAFYNGDLDTLCVVIGCHYDISDENVKLAASIISSLPEGVISPVPNRAAALQAFSRRWLSGDLKRSGNKWTMVLHDALQAPLTDSRLLSLRFRDKKASTSGYRHRSRLVRLHPGSGGIRLVHRDCHEY